MKGHNRSDVGTIQKTKGYVVQSSERSLKDNRVTLSNALVRAAQTLTLTEKRLVSAAISKLDSAKDDRSYLEKCDGVGIPFTRITASEYAEAFDVSMVAAYEGLKDASKQLQKRSIYFYDEQHRTHVHMCWVGEARYHDNEGWVELHWWPRVIKHLKGLKKNFTSYKLASASGLRSIYSWRLLELLQQFQHTGELNLTMDEFAHAMEATPKQLQNFANLRRKMIEPAIAELMSKDDWIIVWEAVKAGRKVKALRFRFSRSGQRNLGI
jgi:plasmid replication initiation protein